MKYALIGCGRIATNHVKAVLNNHLEFAAVCDVIPEQMENLLAKHELQNDSSIHRYTDYKEMIEQEQPQLVGIATESGVHAEIALYCIDHGVNVIIEKPMAMSIADANEIIRRSEEKGVKVSACHQNRFNVAVQQMRKALEAGRFGKLAVVKFQNGAVATIEGTTNVYPKNLEETLYLFGENGTVKLGGKSTNNIDVWDFADEGEEDQKNKGLQEATSNVYGNGHTSLYADMIDAIEHDRKPYVDAHAGKNALELVLAIYKSQTEGRPVKLPLEDFASIDMKGEF